MIDYRPNWHRFISGWVWEFWRYRVRDQFRRTGEFDMVDAGYCLDAMDRIK